MSTDPGSGAYATGPEDFDAAYPAQSTLGWPNITDIESFFDTTDVVNWVRYFPGCVQRNIQLMPIRVCGKSSSEMRPPLSPPAI